MHELSHILFTIEVCSHTPLTPTAPLELRVVRVPVRFPSPHAQNPRLPPRPNLTFPCRTAGKMDDTDFIFIIIYVIYEQETGWGGLRGSSVWLAVERVAGR